MKPAPTTLCIALALFAGASATFGHDNVQKKKPAPIAAQLEEKPFGKAGDLKRITRTVTITMSDAMRYTPDSLTVKRGETIRFVVKNNGKIMHELVIGAMNDLKEHAALMKKFPAMEHDEPYMAHVAPGKSEIIVWQFTKPGEFYFGCLILGHFEAGMIGKITVKS
ncbi:MAG: cupredoxin family protein [Burkholderiales bacterium]